MAQPVWVLSVDLQTKTATFQSGMADAARAARGSFNDIKTGASEMAGHTGAKMTEARHGVLLLGEEFGVHLPRGITSFIASLGPVGAAMEAAFPFLAIIVGATLLLEHLGKMREEAEKLTQNQEKFETAANNAFNALDEKLLSAGIRADELRKDHLGALHRQLALIDKQSFDELVHSFDIVAKAADVVFAELKSHWFTMGIGSAGAQHALESFKTQYERLISLGKDKEASDLLAGTRASAEFILAMQKQFLSSQAQFDNGVLNAPTKGADLEKFEEASLALKKAGVGTTEKEVKAQEQLVEALGDTVKLEGKVSELKKLQQGNARTTTGKEITNDAFKALKAQVDAENVLQAAEDKDREEARTRAIADIQETEKEKIAATEKGSAARLAAIDAAIKEENNKGLQETSFFKSLLSSRVEVIREIADEESRIKEQAGKEQAAHDTKIGELQIAAEHERAQLLNSARRLTIQELIEQEVHEENELHSFKLAALAREIAALDKHGKDYQNKLKAIQDKEAQLTKEHQNKLTQITDQAEIERNKRILDAETKVKDIFAQGFASVILGHESFAALMSKIGDQVLTGLIQNAIQSALITDLGKEKDAAKAARKAFLWGWEHGGPAAPILAPTLGAAAFAATMAFAEGGIVPGNGRGDIVPAVLTPGEHVADKELTDGLRGLVRDGGGKSAHSVHVNFRPTYNVQTIDGNGICGVLSTHAEEFQKHFENAFRKLNH